MKKRMRNVQFVAGVLLSIALGVMVFVLVKSRILKNSSNFNVNLISSEESFAEVVSFSDEEIPLGKKIGDLVVETEADQVIIPDKYNTGAQGKLTKIGLGEKVSGIQMVIDGSGSKNVLDFANRNKDINGTILIVGCDFTGNDLAFYNEGKTERSITLIFQNCSFANITKGAGQSNVRAEFVNCSICNFSGCNASFDWCHFGNSYRDGLNPYNDVRVTNCYFSDMNDTNSIGTGKHTDGTQIYGKQDILAENIEFINCRFEIPAIPLGGNSAAINACIMLQLEYSSGKNIHFKDCLTNGGGYTIYARTVKDEFTFSDVSFSGIRVGCSKLFGTFNPVISKGIKLEDLSEVDSLYIGSVWKEGKKTHFSVTNDTNQARKLTIYTDKGTYNYEVAPCPLGSQLTEQTTFKSLPLDLDIVIPKDCSYAVCFDTTIKGMEKQIRFVNWKGKNVYLSVKDTNETSIVVPIVQEGVCGKNVTFTLSQDGVLTLRGTGSTYDYHSQALPPWENYKYLISTIVVEEGVTRLGNQLFNKCSAISKVVLCEGIESIGGRTFAGCTSLLSISLPTTLREFGNSTFANSTVFFIECTQEQYDMFSIDSGLVDRLVLKK